MDQLRTVLVMLAFIAAVCLVLFLLGCEEKTAFDEFREPCDPWVADPDDEAYWKEYWENLTVAPVFTPEPVPGF